MIEYTFERRCFSMALKGQKFEKYSIELTMEILKKHNEDGIPITRLEKEYNISQNTIYNWNRKYNLHPELYPGLGKKRGRLKESNLTKEDWKERYEILKKYQAFLKAQRERK